MGVDLLSTLEKYGVGRRRLDDDLFASEKSPARLGVYDEDEEDLCHNIIKTSCTIPGCKFTADSLLDFENHYNASHRYTCSQCKKLLPSPHLLDLHIQEQHDSFFAVMAARKPSYSCYIEECKEKFNNAEERLDHCVKIHKLPKDFRFEQKPKQKTKNRRKKQTGSSMDVDVETNCGQKEKKVTLCNNKQKVFKNYFAKKDTQKQQSSIDVDIDEVMADIKESLP